MKRKMIVSIAQLTGGQRERILAAAERHGFEALFLDREEDARQALDGAEILFSESPPPQSVSLPRFRPEAIHPERSVTDEYAPCGSWHRNR